MIHQTSLVSKKAIIGEGTEVGPFCVIGDDVKIGKNNKIISHVSIVGNTTINDNNTFFPYSSIGSKPQDLKFDNEISFLEIGSNNTFRENVTISKGTEDGGMTTNIKNNNLFMTGVHIAHDCKINNNNIFVNQVTLGGHVNVLDNVVIGGLSAVIQFVTIGSYSMIGGMSGIDKNVLPFSLAVGNRAKLRGLNLVGIRRNNFNKDEINKISSIHESFINKNINLSTNDKVESIFHEYKSILNEKLGHIQK